MKPPVRAILAVLLPFAVGVGAGHLQIRHETQLYALCMEDELVEWATTLAFLAAACALLTFRTARGGTLWHWALGLLFFFIAGEEISWGQRLLGIATPQPFVAGNVQGEMNLHNLAGVHDKVRALGLLFVFGVFLAVPLLHRVWKPFRRLVDRLRFPVSSLWGAPAILAGILCMALPRWVFPSIHSYNLDEVGELLLAAGCLAFAWNERTRARPVDPGGAAGSPGSAPARIRPR